MSQQPSVLFVGVENGGKITNGRGTDAQDCRQHRTRPRARHNVPDVVRWIVDRSVDSAVDSSPRLRERLCVSANCKQAATTIDA